MYILSDILRTVAWSMKSEITFPLYYKNDPIELLPYRRRARYGYPPSPSPPGGIWYTMIFLNALWW